MAVEDPRNQEPSTVQGQDDDLAGAAADPGADWSLGNPLNIPLAVFTRSQEQAIKVASDTLSKVRAMASGSVNASTEVLMQQVTELSGAVVGMAGSATGLAGAISQPMQDFIVQQRRMSETIAKFAEAQAELATIVAEFAQRQAATVAAIERVTNPVFDLVGTTQPEPGADRK